MLDDNRREAVAAVGDFSHPTSLPCNRAPDPDRYPDNTAEGIGAGVEADVAGAIGERRVGRFHAALVWKPDIHAGFPRGAK